MTVLELRPSAEPVVPAVEERRPRRWSTVAWLAAICAGLAVTSLRPGSNTNAFQDEGLYLFMGHRMIDHVVDGVHVSEYPGGYFSGAPGLYPVLGALADSIGGLEAARILSLVFMMVAVIGTYGAGSQLFGRTAGLLGAGALSVCGSVIFVSHLATFDAMAMALIALGFWVTVYSAQHSKFLFAPIVGVIMAVAFFTKYGTAVYVPGLALVGIVLSWNMLRWGSVRRGIMLCITAAATAFFVITFWAGDLMGGIEVTTTDRTPISPASASDLVSNSVAWVGPWLLLAVLGGLTMLRRWPLVAVLLLLSIIVPLQQIRIGESTSLAKHVGFGIIFAAPLIGALGAWLFSKSAWIAVPFVAVVGSALLVSGLSHSQRFLTTWVDDRAIVEQLRTEIDRSPGKAVLGEEPSAQRYALRGEIDPILWSDTFGFLYGGESGIPAYQTAIDQSHFGTIYLTTNTSNGKLINQYLTDNETPYRLSAKVPFTRYDEFAGYYLVWTPKVLETR
ncbi:hypothetical protein GCM10007304_49000 [Rhodococcoides trifolii]|uniref:Glycosyltransferase RgtA/B/C/D-like domain-containing protein n=1 Tax=Rhodococcoides trifolii TaxID=908250 RepID=A0A917LJ85_9NOCA|nr:glycosyltransferase family 39 protein [Rhodococcus trifolii]GGG29363.1 hypothetical protein GCM10007304_49000 [Rhodococcus trifolii]